MKPYDTIGDARRQMELADLIPDPATDPVFMAAARAAVIAGGNIPWSDLPHAPGRPETARPASSRSRRGRRSRRPVARRSLASAADPARHGG